MAKKRMFDLDIIDTDLFLEMPTSARLLYFDLGMRADDDGFVASPKKIIKMTNVSEDDLKILFAKKFVIPFESGVCVIRHWKINNYLRGDRYKETIYTNEKRLLNEDENGIYEIGIPIVNQTITNGIHSIDKNRIEEKRIDKISIDKISIDKKTAYGEYKRIKLTDSEYEKLILDYSQEIIDKQIIKLDEYIESNNNKNKYTNYNLVLRKSLKQKWFEDKKNINTTNKNNFSFVEIANEMEANGEW